VQTYSTRRVESVMNIPYFIIAVIFFFIGFFGLIIPVIPDLVVIWLGVLIYAIGTKFSEISISTVILLGLLSLTTYLIDYLAAVLGAKRYGASKKGIVAGIIGGMIGIVIFPLLGFVIGAVAGIIIAEIYLVKRSPKDAIRASKGAFLGFFLGVLTKIVITGVIIGIFLSAIL